MSDAAEQLQDTLFRLQQAQRGVKNTPFRRKVERAYTRAIKQGRERLQWRLFLRLYPGVLLGKNDPVFDD